MDLRIVSIAFAAGLATCAPTALEREHEGFELEIEVHVYNYARVPHHVMVLAQREVARIFGETGVSVGFATCALTPEDSDRFSECRGSRRQTDLVVAIVPRKMASKISRNREVFGVANCSIDEFGYHAKIFHHRVEDYAKIWHASPSLLLGHIIAHEIGHLLLGGNSHSQSGIMHGPWTRAERESIHHGGLLFTSAEAKRIRENVWRRQRLNP